MERAPEGLHLGRNALVHGGADHCINVFAHIVSVHNDV